MNFRSFVRVKNVQIKFHLPDDDLLSQMLTIPGSLITQTPIIPASAIILHFVSRLMVPLTDGLSSQSHSENNYDDGHRFNEGAAVTPTGGLKRLPSGPCLFLALLHF